MHMQMYLARLIENDLQILKIQMLEHSHEKTNLRSPPHLSYFAKQDWLLYLTAPINIMQ